LSQIYWTKITKSAENNKASEESNDAKVLKKNKAEIVEAEKQLGKTLNCCV